jgi:YjbE family integral membrane protein
METMFVSFFSSLFAIFFINLILSGDNAVVIAIVARRLPVTVRARAIRFGAAGAVVVRILMTLIAIWLLHFPGLMLAGGLMLAWIAYKLLDQHSDEGEVQAVNPSTGFWGAMKTIIVADAIMGIDNVLAIAGVAQGSMLLVVIGLVIGIPIVVWGSTLILHLVERYAVINYIGAAILAWTAANLISEEHLLKPYLPGHQAVIWVLRLGLIAIVLAAGYWHNRSARRQARAEEISATPPPPV